MCGRHTRRPLLQLYTPFYEPSPVIGNRGERERGVKERWSVPRVSVMRMIMMEVVQTLCRSRRYSAPGLLPTKACSRGCMSRLWVGRGEWRMRVEARTKSMCCTDTALAKLQSGTVPALYLPHQSVTAALLSVGRYILIIVNVRACVGD